jgi:hypothetical protein
VTALLVSVYAKIGLTGVSWIWNGVANAIGLYGYAEGVLAQEVLEKYPDTVGVDESGWLFVRYDLLNDMIGRVSNI